MQETMIPVVAILMPAVLVPSVMALKLAARKREMAHAERMRALELGQPIPGSEGWRAATCMAIGAGVPVGTFVLAWLATLTGAGEAGGAWAAAAVVGILGVLSGTRMSMRLMPSRQRPADLLADDELATKPQFDPDTYDDVVGRRG